MQIFRRPLLETFEAVANYHNALLPSYRGLAATRWSIYHNEPTTGFTFHLMDEAVDNGPILAQKEMVLPPQANVEETEYAKTELATGSIEDVLRALVARDPGRPQEGPTSYYGGKQLLSIRTIEVPEEFAWRELRRRLHAFGSLEICFDGRPHEVTRLDEARGARIPRRSPRFTTVDGVDVAATRLGFLPPSLYYSQQRAKALRLQLRRHRTDRG